VDDPEFESSDRINLSSAFLFVVRNKALLLKTLNNFANFV